MDSIKNILPLIPTWNSQRGESPVFSLSSKPSAHAQVYSVCRRKTPACKWLNWGMQKMWNKEILVQRNSPLSVSLHFFSSIYIIINIICSDARWGVTFSKQQLQAASLSAVDIMALLSPSRSYVFRSVCSSVFLGKTTEKLELPTTVSIGGRPIKNPFSPRRRSWRRSALSQCPSTLPRVIPSRGKAVLSIDLILPLLFLWRPKWK